uniref:Secreted protein n=1 Tax=Romanomermis culicivorax TaxID=13658 RepID=A0A915J7B6_ROMCU
MALLLLTSRTGTGIPTTPSETTPTSAVADVEEMVPRKICSRSMNELRACRSPSVPEHARRAYLE